jgi:hypothetical protein
MDPVRKSWLVRLPTKMTAGHAEHHVPDAMRLSRATKDRCVPMAMVMVAVGGWWLVARHETAFVSSILYPKLAAASGDKYALHVFACMADSFPL